MTKTCRKIEADYNGRKRTYLIPLDPYAADRIHVDVHDPNSRGYGGSSLTFELEDGSAYKAKGPWHTNSEALLNDTGLDIRELHGTQVTIWSYDEKEMTFDEYTRQDDGTLKWGPVTKMRPVEGEILYEESERVLGDFHRGERIAQAIADLLQKPVKFKSQSYGGSTSAWKQPNEPIEPRKANPAIGLSAEQQAIVES